MSVPQRFAAAVVTALLVGACAGAGPALPPEVIAPEGSPRATTFAPSPAVSRAPATASAAARDVAVEPFCLAGMAHLDSFCIDQWEAHLVELDAQGGEHAYSPYERVGGRLVRAKTAAGVVPQAYVSQLEASTACAAAGKRLCSSKEFARACRGPDAENWFPYGGKRQRKGVCNDDKFSAVAMLYGMNSRRWTYENFNDPRLNQLEGGLAKSGANEGCVSPDGVFDMVGNLAEWVDDPPDKKGKARFRGGYYGQAMFNGPGCLYVTSAHEADYHDYSVGFRCCKDALD